jgi:hypothetical protein
VRPPYHRRFPLHRLEWWCPPSTRARGRQVCARTLACGQPAAGRRTARWSGEGCTALFRKPDPGRVCIFIMLLVRHDAVAFSLAIVVTIVLCPIDGRRTQNTTRSVVFSEPRPAKSATLVYRAPGSSTSSSYRRTCVQTPCHVYCTSRRTPMRLTLFLPSAIGMSCYSGLACQRGGEEIELLRIPSPDDFGQSGSTDCFVVFLDLLSFYKI